MRKYNHTPHHFNILVEMERGDAETVRTKIKMD